MVRLPQDYEEGLLFEQNEPMRLKVSVTGRPLPEVTWFHDGEEIRGGDRFEVIHTDKYTALKLACVKRSDRGCYQIQAVNALGDHTASFLVTVTDRPSPPGKVHVSKTSGKSVTLSWKAPEDDGGCKIGNFIIEYNRVGWDMWLKASTSRQLTADLDDLLEGSEYRFRVKAENPYGISKPSDVSEPIFLPDIKRGIFKQTNTASLLFEDDEKLVKTQETNMLEFFGRKSKSPEPSTKPRKLSVDEVSPPVPKRRKKKLKDEINNSKTDIYRSMSFLDVSAENAENWQQPIEQKDHWGLAPELKTNNGRTSPRDSLNSQNMPVLDYKAKRNSTESLIKLNFERESAPPISLSSPELGPESEVFEEHIRNSYSSSELLYERNLSRFNGYKNDENLSSEAQKIAIYAMDRKNSLRRSPITRRSNDGSEEKSVFSDSDSVQSVIEASKRTKNASSFMSLANSIEEVLENTGREIIGDNNDKGKNDNTPFTLYDSSGSGISKESEDEYVSDYDSDGEFINFGNGKRALQEQKASSAFFSTVYYDEDYLSDQKLSDRERSTSPAALREIEKSDEMSQDSLNTESTSSSEYSDSQQLKNKTDTTTEICTVAEPNSIDPQKYRPRDGIPKYVMLPNPFYKERETSMIAVEVPEGSPSHNRVKFELSSNSDEIVPPEIPRRTVDGSDSSHLALPVITVTETSDHSPKSVLKKIFMPEFSDQNESYYDRYNNVNSSAFGTLKQRSPEREDDDNKKAAEVLQEDANMVVVKHYGDILERYSDVVKKPSSKTYLDFEQLKLAAVECESPVVLVDDRPIDKCQDDDNEDELESYEMQYEEEEEAYGREQPIDGDLDNQVVNVADDRLTSMMLQDHTSTNNAIPYLKIFGNLSLALFGYWLYTFKSEKLSVPVFGFLLVRFFKTQIWDRI
uniref:Titin n=2 Tax=Sipha flava TaxID=143950 RepID=A0A2S2Q9M5_9HEMI